MKHKPVPNWLDKIAGDYWKRFAHRVSEEDTELLALLCQSYSNYHKAQEAVSLHGVLIETQNGSNKQNPATYVIRDCQSQITNIMRQLELTPKSRKKVTTEADTEDELDQFLKL